MSREDAAAAGTATPAAMRVLIVEDDAAVAKPLHLLLDHYGYDARIATTVAAAIQEVDGWLPHAVLIDLKLPDGNGSAVFSYVRGRAPHTRVAILSGAVHDQRVITALAPLRPDHVFPKPTDFLQIREWLDAVRRGT